MEGLVALRYFYLFYLAFSRNDQYRARSSPCHTFRHTARYEMFKTGTSMRAHNDEVCRPFAGHGKYFLFRVTDPIEGRSEEHTSELKSLMRTSYAVSCLIKN